MLDGMTSSQIYKSSSFLPALDRNGLLLEFIGRKSVVCILKKSAVQPDQI